MNVGNRINELRKNLNVTMQQLSTLTGISQPVLSKLETGNRTPDVPTLEKICEAFSITLSEFFNDNSNSMALTPELKELLNHAKDLTPEQLELLSKFIGSIK